MEKRPLFPLLPANGDQHQGQRQRPQQGDPAMLESSLLLLLSASSVAAPIAPGPGLPLPPVQALPLRVPLQQSPQQHELPMPLLPLMFVHPPPPPPIRRKRILPRIVAPQAADETASGAVMSGGPAPVPMPVRCSRSLGVATALPVLISAAGGAVVSAAVADTTASPWSVQSSSSNSPLTLVSSAPESSRAATVIRTTTEVDDVPSPTTTEEKPLKKKRIRVKTDRRREQCRANQARYRNKQRGEAVVLEERVEQLRAEVSNLERQRQLQCSGADISEVPMQIVIEYFRLFRHGLSVEAAADETVARPSVSQQIAFIQSIMAPDLQFGDSRGVDGLIEQWRRYSWFHGDLAFKLESAFSVEKKAARASHRASYNVHTTASLMLTITQETIRRVFPHVNSLKQLKTKLLDKRVRYPCSLVFEFDEFDKVQALVCSMDYMASLQEIVGNVHELVVLLENARIRHDFFLLGEGEEPQQ